MKCEPKTPGQATVTQLWVVPLLLASSAACSQPSAPEVHSSPANSSKEAAVAQASHHPAVANLPFAQGRSFASLDEYLEFRKARGAHDVPWYREIRPDLYELVSRRGPGTEAQTYTREELARKFGFHE